MLTPDEANAIQDDAVLLAKQCTDPKCRLHPRCTFEGCDARFNPADEDRPMGDGSFLTGWCFPPASASADLPAHDHLTA